MLSKRITIVEPLIAYGVPKKSFSILALLVPPANLINGYSGYVSSSKNIEVGRILDTPIEKRYSIRKEVFY